MFFTTKIELNKMSQIKKKGKISLPPSSFTPNVENSEAMQEMIKRGGDVSKSTSLSEDKLKSFTVKIYESELDKIRRIIKTPKKDGAIGRYQKKKSKSMQEFIIEAILEKIEKEELN